MPFFGGMVGELSFVSGNGYTAAPQILQINNAGAGTLNWTATTNVFQSVTTGTSNWLTVSSSVGTAPSALT